MWRRQSELPTWLQQQLRLRRLHGGNSQAVPARARRCSSARIQVLLPQHRGGLIYSSALQKEWCSEELLLLLLLRDARPGAARDKGGGSGLTRTCPCPGARGRKDSPGWELRAAKSPGAVGLSPPRALTLSWERQEPSVQGHPRSPWPNRLQRQIAMQGAHPRKHRLQSTSRAWWELF